MGNVIFVFFPTTVHDNTGIPVIGFSNLHTKKQGEFTLIECRNHIRNHLFIVCFRLIHVPCTHLVSKNDGPENGRLFVFFLGIGVFLGLATVGYNIYPFIE